MYTSLVNLKGDDTSKYVSFTSTYKPPTEKECKGEVIDCAKRLAKLKWFNDKSFLRNRIKYYADILNKIDEMQAEEYKKHLKKKFKIK